MRGAYGSEYGSEYVSECGGDHDSKCGRAISVGTIKDDTAEFRTKHPYILALCFMVLGLLVGGTFAYAAGLLPSLLIPTATLHILLTLHTVPTVRSAIGMANSCHQGKPQIPLCSDT